MEPNDPIQPEEIMLRRVPEARMGDGSPRWPLPDAFDPTKPDARRGTLGDVDGISVYRRHFHTPKEAADFRTKSKSQTWMACLG